MSDDEAEAKKTLRQIGLGYREYLSGVGLRDEPLARMTYFQAARKVYQDQPLEPAALQELVTKQLDEWIAEIYDAMNAAA